MNNFEREQMERLHKQSAKLSYAFYLTLEAIFEKTWLIEGLKKEDKPDFIKFIEENKKLRGKN